MEVSQSFSEMGIDRLFLLFPLKGGGLININNLRTLRAIFVEIHMTILDKRVLIIKMNKLIKKFQIEQNFKLVWIDVSHFKLER